MKMRIKKRMLSLFLALTLCLTPLQCRSFAEVTNGDISSESITENNRSTGIGASNEVSDSSEAETSSKDGGTGVSNEKGNSSDAGGTGKSDNSNDAGDTGKSGNLSDTGESGKSDSSSDTADAGKGDSSSGAGSSDKDNNPSHTVALTEGNGQPAAPPASTAEGNGQPTNTGEGEQPDSETDTRTEIWCKNKPDSIGRSYDGTTDGSMIRINLTFTDGTNEIAFEEGTDFTAVKTFDSADAGNHTVTVEITLIDEAADKYKLRAGEEKFEIDGCINKAYPKLTVSISETTCAVGEKLLPLLSVDGAPEDAEATYYYLAAEYKNWAGSSDAEGSEAMPRIDENTAISEPGTYYVYAKTGETKNYKVNRSTTVEFTVAEKVDPVASVTAADGTETTYGSFTDAWTAAIASKGSTLKLLDNADIGDADDGLSVDSGEFTLDLNGKTLSGSVYRQLIGVSGNADIIIKNGSLVNTFSKDQSDINLSNANVVNITGGKVVLENVEVTSGRGKDGAQTGAVYVFDGSLTVTSGTFTGAIVVVTQGIDDEPTLKIKSATLHNGIGYQPLGSGAFDYDGVRALFADGSMLFDKDGKYIDIEKGEYWVSDGTGEDADTGFFYSEESVVKPHTDTIINGKCSHGGKNGFTFEGTEYDDLIRQDTCPYCGALAVACAELKDGEDFRWRKFVNLQDALDVERYGGSTLYLLTEVTGSYTIDGTQDTELDLNGHSINGNVDVKAVAEGKMYTTTFSNTKNTTTASIKEVTAHSGAKLAGSGYPAVIGKLWLADTTYWEYILSKPDSLGFKVLNDDGTHKWYAPIDKSMPAPLENVIINSLPITFKSLSFKANGKNVTGNKVERGTTVQLCANCNTKDAEVTIYIGEIVGNNEPTYSKKQAEYKKIGSMWYYVVDLPCNTIGKYSVYFTATKDGYTVTSNTKTLTVTKLDLSKAEITFPDGNEAAFNYVTATGVPKFTVTYNGKELEQNVDFTITSGGSTCDVGPCTLTVTAAEDGDYTGSKSAEWNVRPLKVAVSVGDIIKTYDGTTDLPANAKITFVSADSYYIGAPLPLERTDYEVFNARYDSADASETEKTISFTIKLKNEGYVFEDGTKEKTFALKGAELKDQTFKINQAPAPAATPGSLTITNGLHKTYSLDLRTLLPKLTAPCDYGKIIFDKKIETNLGVGSFMTHVDGRSGKLTLKVFDRSGTDEGQFGTITVTVAPENYDEIKLTINVSATNKIIPQADGELTATDISYGQTLGDSKITGKMKDPDTGAEVKGTFTWTDGTVRPAANDSYQAEWKFTPEDTESYAEAAGTVTVKVNKATPTGAPKYTEITTGGKTLKDAALTTDGSTLNPDAGRLEWVDEEGNVLPDDTKVEADKTYRWRFTPDDANYKVLTGEVKLYHKHEGGGSSGGSSGSSGSGNSSGTSSRNRDWSRSDLPYYVVKDGKWFRDNLDRWFFSTDRLYTDEWGALINPYADTLRGQSGFDWFRFGNDSVMTTGWYTDVNGDTYYLNPVSDNTLGRMFVGWHWIDDNKDGISECYYFQEASDGRRGRLYKGTTTPDGYTVNEKGQWTVDGVVQTKK